MLPSELKEHSEMDDVTSPPLELRRPASGPRTIPVPHNLQSPSDRATGKLFKFHSFDSFRTIFIKSNYFNRFTSSTTSVSS